MGGLVAPNEISRSAWATTLSRTVTSSFPSNRSVIEGEEIAAWTVTEPGAAVSSTVPCIRMGWVALAAMVSPEHVNVPGGPTAQPGADGLVIRLGSKVTTTRPSLTALGPRFSASIVHMFCAPATTGWAALPVTARSAASAAVTVRLTSLLAPFGSAVAEDATAGMTVLPPTLVVNDGVNVNAWPFGRLVNPSPVHVTVRPCWLQVAC